ncbi:MAG: enoyl-CoA hydratase-related protein, partial [bacterium]
MTELEYLSVEKENEIAIVAIDRQGKLNALNYKMLQELEGVFTDLSQDENLRGVILIGRGNKSFVAGADIEELADLNRQSGRSQSGEGQRVFTLIENFQTPVLAAVNGYALGGGCELALACHLRVASKNAKFGFPEVGLGIIPGFGGTVRLSRVVGFGRAIEMILTGNMITADRAEHFGLVSAVFEPDEL